MKNTNKFKFGFAGLFLFVSLWQIFYLTKNDPTITNSANIFKSLVTILKDEKSYANLVSTLKIVSLGVGCSALVGVTTGIIMDLSARFRYTFNPILELFRNIPSITLFPILLVVYGIGDMSRIFVIFWTATPPIILSTIYGLRTIDKSLIEAGQENGANTLQIMRYIKLPLAMPEILNGVKIAIGSGFVAVVVAEMLGASSGLGYMVMWSTNAFKYSETYAYIIIIALTGAVFNYIMSAIINQYERKLL